MEILARASALQMYTKLLMMVKSGFKSIFLIVSIVKPAILWIRIKLLIGLLPKEVMGLHGKICSVVLCMSLQIT